MLEGVIPNVEYFWALGSFEWAVKSVANGAPLNNVSVDEFSHAAAERLLSIRSMVPCGQQASAATSTQLVLQGQAATLSNEEQTCTLEKHTTDRIEGMGVIQQGTHHTDRMKKLFNDQKDAWNKINEELATTSAEKEAYVTRIQVLSHELAGEKLAHLEANSTIDRLHAREEKMQKLLDKSRIDIEEARGKLKALDNVAAKDVNL
ncbi:hypothetical protein J4E91_003772 [Alternaria rosae]|nr:hypothetical protein J4E91_003772 [Alternaria rosae]